MRFRHWLVISGWLVALLLVFFPALLTPLEAESNKIQEPYPPLHGGSYANPPVPESLDPLVAYRWNSPSANDGLQIFALPVKQAWAAPPTAVVNLDSIESAKANVTIDGPVDIRLDFGSEAAAWVEFDSPDLAGSVEMSISEYNLPWPGKTAVPVRHVDTYRLELNRELYEGVRFAWIHVRSVEHPWHITAVRLVCQVKPTNYEGTFASSDPMLTRIWYAGAYAVKLNLLKDSFGAILIDRGDRLTWTGDAHPAQAASMTAFGNWDFVKQNLQRTSHTDKYGNDLESYPLYWVLSLVDYYRSSGDQAGFDSMAPIAQDKIAHGAIIWANPHILFYGWDERLGAGFETPDMPEAKLAYQALFIHTCREFAWAMQQRGRPDKSEEFARMADAFAQKYLAKPGWPTEVGLHAAADAVNAVLPNRSEAQQIYAREFAEPIGRLSYSPFNEYFVLQALARIGKYDDALRTVRDMWGGELLYGGTCFFEVYRPSWNDFLKPNDPVPNGQAGYTSLCHPWGSGVTSWLSQEVLGIKATSPGFSTYSVLPHLGRTLTRVSGKTPTPHGSIAVAFDALRGTMNLDAPPATKGMIGIPKQERNIQQVKCNGHLIWDGRFHKLAGIENAREDPDFVYLTDVQPGRYSLQIRFKGNIPEYVETPARYTATVAKEDDTTQGNWPGHYGSAGYILFNHAGNDHDETRLPGYVASVTPQMTSGGQWSADANDPRTLPASAQPNAPRRIGFLTTTPNWPKMAGILEIKMKADHEFQVALYMVDWEHKSRRMTVEMFDSKTLKLVAPVRLISDFSAGKYLVYRYDRSCEFRLVGVRGPDMPISAIFFDP